MKLLELLSSLSFYKSSNSLKELDINSIQMDHRLLVEGDLFVCIKGYTVDGHDFAEKAIEKGAIAIISEKDMTLSVPVIIVSDASRALAMLATKFCNYPTEQLDLIGITGTNGKTTITYLLEKIFNVYKKKTGLIGTIQMKIGGEEYPINNTTPNALELQSIFKKMKDENVDQAIMEVSSHALDQGRVFGCDYDIAVFSNLSQDHLDYHKNMDDYLRAKSLLFAQLGNNYSDKKKFAVINEDDKASDVLKKSTSQQVITYGIEKEADITAIDVKLGITETTFSLNTPIGSIDIRSHLIGKFNVYNMLAATGAALAKDIPLITIKEALENVLGVHGRFEPVKVGQPFAVIVDYAHTPDSLENVLQTINGFAANNTCVVVGCGGDRDKLKRPLMAQIAAKHTDHVIFTSDNPRTEDPVAILTDMVEGLKSNKKNYEIIEDRQKAINKAINMAKADDVILIAGKGHETYQIIGKTKFEFDDSKVAEAAIVSKGM